MGNNNVLVTGANGFVGTALLDKLIEESQCNNIIALYRNELPNELQLRYGDSVQWIKADITINDLAHTVKNIDTVYHLAAYFPKNDSQAETVLLQQINVIGTERLAIAAKQSNVRHFIYVSSIAACESGLTSPINEVNGFPTSAYGKSKKAAENILQKIASDNFAVTILRPTALFGENHLGSIFELIKIINKGWFLLIGDGKNLTNFYYIQDFIEILIKVKNNEKSFGEIFIVADTPYPLKELILGISQLLKRRCHILQIPLFLGYVIASGCDVLTKITGKTIPFSKRRYFAMTRDITYSTHKLTKTLQVFPKNKLLEGLQRTIKWYQKMGYI